MREPQAIAALLREFVTGPFLNIYYSSLCWGCERVKHREPCDSDCLLFRGRQALDIPEPTREPI